MYYRILTEDKNRKQVEKLVLKYFDSFTMIEGIGYWQGKRERCLIIEIDQVYQTMGFLDVFTLAHEIKTLNQQHAVLVQEVILRSDIVYD